MRSVRAALCPPRTPAVPTEYAKSYERVPESAAAARHLVSEALHVWHLPQLADTAALITTELVSNAIRHAKGEEMRVDVTRLTEQRVRVSVVDQDSTRPQMQEPDPGGEGGRGLFLVNAESSGWGVDVLPGGKRVWADLEAL
ncbi:ATP-binding protein [Actinacidiphila acididurans]|uniref:ATP-binding protein n=1 Tax=Actinacidiphila acididurans TaxID=2784346 RepID=A0ABS2TTU7_9ACTN|nr:ATP-binding protein [Actinacidiphila acididurans]MBM9506758.1 ATP-binding protein [Actinacidiphila acididurans]